MMLVAVGSTAWAALGVVVTAVTSAGGAAWFSIRHNNRRIDAETDATIVGSASNVVLLQAGALARLEAESQALRIDVQNLTMEVRALSVDGQRKADRIQLLEAESREKDLKQQDADLKIRSLEDHMLTLENEVVRLGGIVPSRSHP